MSDFYSLVERPIQKACNKIDGRVIDIAEQPVVDASEIVENDHNKARVKDSLRSAPNKRVIVVLNEFTYFRGSFEDTNM